MGRIERTLWILRDLVALPTVPGEMNEQWVTYVSALMTDIGARVTAVPSPLDDCEGVLVSIGPDAPGGIVLSGHMDVVPVDGQDWQHPPFDLTRRNGRVYGRGTTDMKGFVACALATLEQAAGRDLDRPVHLVLSADEESTCRSAISLARRVAQDLPPVRGVLVGEPTRLRPVNRQKGSFTYAVTVTGRAAHAGQPENGLSAIALAARLVSWLEERSAAASGLRNTTHSIGTIGGGTASNVVAGDCRFEWDIRLGLGDDLDGLMAEFTTHAETLLHPLRDRFPEAAVDIRQIASFPGFDTPPDHAFARDCMTVAGVQTCDSLEAGTEAGLFQAEGLPVIVMGPGDLQQAHIPDEFIETAQLEGCLSQLDRLI